MCTNFPYPPPLSLRSYLLNLRAEQYFVHTYVSTHCYDYDYYYSIRRIKNSTKTLAWFTTTIR